MLSLQVEQWFGNLGFSTNVRLSVTKIISSTTLVGFATDRTGNANLTNRVYSVQWLSDISTVNTDTFGVSNSDIGACSFLLTCNGVG